jgi:hypothetical protein
VFKVACASAAAAKVANSAYLGEKNIKATAAAMEFDPNVLRKVAWCGKGWVRKLLPIAVMKTIIGKLNTGSAEKLFPEFSKLVDDIENERSVPELVEKTSTASLKHTDTLSVFEPASNPTSGTMVVSGSTMLVPNTPMPDVPYSSMDVQIKQWKNYAHLSEIQREACGKQNKFICEQELDLAEHMAKKRKVEQQSDHDAKLATAEAEHTLYKLKLKQIAELKIIATEIGAEERKADLDKISDEFWEKVKNNLIG